jgi:uncharacterized protein YigE (DUF2233 family)
MLSPLAGLWRTLGAVITITFTAAHAASCRDVTFDDTQYRICSANPKVDAIRLFWRQSSGEDYGSLSRLPRTLNQGALALAFAINGGMFDEEQKPVGLYVEGGAQLRPANTRSGQGNFHMKPNGVFFVAGNEVGVLETNAYLKRKTKADYATQSGPMLVIDGKIHPRFQERSSSITLRSGVGLTAAGEIIFAVSRDPVTFFSFARFFRDELLARDALFLDGGMEPSLYEAATGSGDNFVPLGPMIGVYGSPP